MKLLRCALVSAALAACAIVHAQFIWNSGDLSLLNIPLNTLNTGQTLQINTGSDHNLPGQTLTNNGTITWNEGYIRGHDGSLLINSSTGTFNDANSQSYTVNLSGAGTFRFVNNGTYDRNVTGTTYFDVPVDNTGTMSVIQGSVEFRGGGSNSASGVLIAGAAGSIVFKSGFSLSGGSNLLGTGGFHLHGGTFSIDGGATLQNFNQHGGALGGSNTIAANSTYNWNSGHMNSATAESTTIASGATLNVLTGSDHNFVGRTITNHGTVNWHSGYIRGGDSGAFINNATFNDLNSSSYTMNSASGAWTFTNHGSYLRNAGGTTYFDIPFFNDGSVNVQQGAISFRAGGTLATSGTINAAAGTAVLFTSGFNVLSGASLTGPGAFELQGGTFAVNGNINVGSFTQVGGLLAGSNTIASGSYNWMNGSWSAASTSGATTTINTGATLNILTGSDHNLDHRPVTNLGTVNWLSGYIRGGAGANFTNAPGGVFNDLNASSYSVHRNTSGTFDFINQGVYVRNIGGTTYFDTPFINSGQVLLQQGAIEFRDGGTLSSTGTINAATGTAVVFTNGFTIDNSASLSGAGSFYLTGGILTLNGLVDVGSFTQTGGAIEGTNVLDAGSIFNWSNGSWSSASLGPQTTIANGATLNINSGADHNFVSRAIRNEGTVNWNSGYIRSGLGGTFVNAAGATFNDLNASSYTIHNPAGGSFIFTNEGQYTRNVGGTTYIDTTFNNSGAVNLLQGAMYFRGGGMLNPTGTIQAAAGTLVEFTNDFTVQSGASLTGSGAYRLSGGTFTIDGAINVGSFAQYGGTLAGTHSINSGVFDWNNGNWSVGAAGFTTTIGPAATLHINTGADHNFIQRSIVNLGTTQWNSGYIRGGQGSTFANAGLFIDSNTSSYTIHNPVGGGFAFENEGTYRRIATGTSYIDVPFINEGTIDMDGGEIAFRAPLSLEATSTLNFSLGGTTLGSDYGHIESTVSLTLAGLLALDLRNGFETTISHANTFTLLSVSSGTLSGGFANVTSGSRLLTTDGYGTFRVDYGATSPFGATSLVLSDFQAIPEPSTWALLALGGTFVICEKVGRGRRTRR